MKRVKCISPHGGCHNGMDHNGLAIHRIPIYGADAAGNKVVVDSKLREVDPEKLRLPPNPGGYVYDGRIPGGHAAVGQVYEVDDSFYADGFHWSELGPKDKELGATQVPSPSDTATGGDGE